jgi:hypothetical protein
MLQLDAPFKSNLNHVKSVHCHHGMARPRVAIEDTASRYGG